MSSKYPEPPKLTNAKALMKQKVNPKPPVEEPVQEAEPTQPELGSLFLAVPSVPDHTDTDEKDLAQVESKTSEDSSPVENVMTTNDENTVTEIIASEISETDVVIGQVEDKSETVIENTYGGPWGIIKHTGYVTVAIWAVLVAAITGVTAHFLAPGDYTWVPLTVLGFMMGVIAAVDRKTHLIKNQHTIATAVLTVPLAAVIAFNLNPWNILFGLLAAVVVFGVFIFLIIKVNFGSGGDIKFSPIPAFALGVVNPLISALWLFYALIITVVLLVVRKQKRTSFGEGMAISLPFAIASVYALYSAAGLPYMEPATLL